MADGIKKLRNELKALKGMSVEAGFFESAKYDDGTAVAAVATVHEFGLGHVPARPFMRVAEREAQKDLVNLMKKGVPAVAEGRLSADALFTRIGGVMVGAIQDAIAHGSHAPLAESTKAAKGFATPLVDTARMLQSVTQRVKSQ